MSWVSRIVNVFRSAHVEDDLDDELRFHLEEKTRRLIGGGLPPDVAAREARRRLGNPLATKERSRDVKLLPWLDALVRDVRFGFRVLRKDAVVTTAAIVSLALAMGAWGRDEFQFRIKISPSSVAESEIYPDPTHGCVMNSRVELV
jgi:hypothetical protein